MHSVGSARNNEIVNVELSEQVSSGPGSSGRFVAKTRTRTQTRCIYMLYARAEASPGAAAVEPTHPSR